MSRTIPSRIVYGVLHKIYGFAYAKITLFLNYTILTLAFPLDYYKRICATFYLGSCKPSFKK